MARKDKAIYAPGELNRVRNNLGIRDHEEARRLADVLGGEVGYERSNEEERALLGKKKGEQDSGTYNPKKIPGHRVELALEDEESGKRKHKRKKGLRPEDDPTVVLKPNYFERVKMDRYAGQPQFEIKTPTQVLFASLSFFGEIPDYVNPDFISRRMNEYYLQIGTLVTSTRSLFPRNNIKRNERIKKTSPFVFVILDTIRRWDIEKISGELTRLQTKDKSVKVEDCEELLRLVYRPLIIMEHLDMETHIRGAFKILYKALYNEDPFQAKAKYQNIIRSALVAYSDICRDVSYLMYPLFLKVVSAKWLSYDAFFAERRNRIMAFLNVNEFEQINPEAFVRQINIDSQSTSNVEIEDGPIEKPEEVKLEDEETMEQKAQRLALEAEKKALDRGINTLEILFPKAGWDHLESFPDLYPYFADIFDLRKNFVYVAPNDPLQQVYILMRILEELFFALRYVVFGRIVGVDTSPDTSASVLMGIINDWQYYLQSSFEKEYLPRLAEYVRLLESSPENRNSAYTRKILVDLHWIKRLNFLPYHKFQSVNTPSFQKRDITPLYPEIQKLRRYLAAIGISIEKGNRAGGAEERVHCDGIDNPWAPYVFEVPNPVSTRLNALLAQKNRTNASLVFFSLATVTVLDNLVNNEKSWAYTDDANSCMLFRSVGGAGIIPLTGIETRIDADGLFKAALKKRQQSQKSAD